MNRVSQISSHLSAMSKPLLNHTMFRIADPNRSKDFYAKHFGMTVVETLKVPELGFTNYFLGFDGQGALHEKKPWYLREGLLELCHNHSATAENFVANNGNKEPHRGFGHICFSVENLEQFCSKLESDGVKFQKRLADGRQKNIAFALDPDGYWIELIENTGKATRFNHTMLRVKDKTKSLNFYINDLGMKLVDERDFPEAKFTLYFLSFDHNPGPRHDTEGLLELTYNYGTEKDEQFVYHTGNEEPQGYGHIGLAVDNVQEFLNKLEAKGVKITKRVEDGKLKFIAFVSDPDGYSYELLPKAEFPDDLFADPK